MYAAPRHVGNLESALIYHTIDLPGETIRGQWDLRDSVDDYLGNVDVRGKRVLDVGTAGGWLTFALEARGADVVSFDMATGEQWDIIPFVYPGRCHGQIRRNVVAEAEMVKAGYWYAHERLQSRAQVYYGDYRRLPADLGTFDIVVVGMILPHVSDPFQLLAAVAPLARETLIVTQQAEQIISAYARWMPQAATCEPDRAWWSLSEGCVSAMLGVVGFECERVTKRGYRRDFENRDEDCTTFVARRRAPDEPPSGTVMLSRAGTDGVRHDADAQDRTLRDSGSIIRELVDTVEATRGQVAELSAALSSETRRAELLAGALEAAQERAGVLLDALAGGVAREARLRADVTENARNLKTALGTLERVRGYQAEAGRLRRELKALRHSRTWRLAGWWWRLRGLAS